MTHTRSVILAGGGTAGHVNPLLATAQALAQQGAPYRRIVLGTAQGLETDLVPAAGEELVTIARLPLPRRPSLDLLRLPGRLAATVRQLRSLLKDTNTGAVVGFGGYVSTPIYIAAALEKVPVIIHEQNARPGLANRLGSLWAKVVALTFHTTPLAARRGETRTIGLPLRPAIKQLAADRLTSGGQLRRRKAAAERFGLDPEAPIVVVTGGSLGAQKLNEICPLALLEATSNPQVIHLTGRGKDGPVRELIARERATERYVVVDYLREMEEALAAADLVICRAGAGTVAELSALGIPAIYIPLAIGNGEQALNAAGVVSAGGAQLVPESALNAADLRGRIDKLLSASAHAAAARAAAECGKVGAAEELAALIVREMEECF